MSLDLHKIASQMEDAVSYLNDQETSRSSRLDQALQTILTTRPEVLESKRSLSRTTFPIAGLQWSIAGRYTSPSLPPNYTVLAVDGSHIDVDRHLAVQCYLLNIGRVRIQYGDSPQAWLGSQPRLYTEEDDLQIIDPGGIRTQPIEGPLIGALRAVEEMKELVALAKEADPKTPTLAMIDGSLILWGLIGQSYPDFVRRVLLEEEFLPALSELRDLARHRPLAIASYISLPRSSDVVNALRLDSHQCPYEVANCDMHCGSLRPQQRPCDAVSGIMDRDVFSSMLYESERSDSFTSTSSIVERYYGEHQIHFFYLNVGPEVARVEVPEWVASNRELLEMAHAFLVDQCRKGHGYPIAIAEAHEQAVVTTKDREEFRSMVEYMLHRHRLPVYTSQKNQSKRLKWL